MESCTLLIVCTQKYIPEDKKDKPVATNINYVTAQEGDSRQRLRVIPQASLMLMLGIHGLHWKFQETWGQSSPLLREVTKYPSTQWWKEALSYS